MAATVEGAYVLIDRASGPLRKMRQEAERTDRAIKKLGSDLDGVGTLAQSRNMERTERSIRNIDRASQSGRVSTSRYRGEMERTGRAAGDLTTRLGRLGAAVKGLHAVLTPGKFIALGAGIGVAAQAVNVLAAGAVALLPRLTDLGGAAAALPTVFAGIGLAAVSAKLAFQDLGKAMGGNKDALKALTPEARQFLGTLQAQQKVITQLRTTAQRGLFPGLDQAIGKLRRGVPTANRLVGQASSTLGSLASRAASNLTTPQMLRDLSSIGGQGVQVLNRLGAGAINLSDALVDVVVAAQPFTDWLSNTVLGWTKWAKAAAQANRENGGLRDFFARTRTSMETFGDILHNLWVTFTNIGHSSRTLGDDLWTSIDRVTKRWADWTTSLTGQNQMRQWFAQAREPLHELGGLVGDLGKALGGFNTGGLTETIRNLRRAVQPVADLFESLGTSFGPDFADAISEVARTLSSLGQNGALGPVTLLLRTFTGILSAVNGLIERIPQLGTVISALVTGAAVAKVGGMFGLTRMLGGGAAAGAGRGLLGGLGAGAAGAAAAGGAVAGRYGLTRAAQTYQIQRQAFGASRAGAGLTAAGGLARAGGGMLAGAAGMLAPLLLLGGGLGAMQGTSGAGAQGLWQNAISGASFGIVPSQSTLNGRESDRFNGAFQNYLTGLPGGGMPSTYGNARAQIGALRGLRGRAATADGVPDDVRNAAVAAINREIEARRQLLPQLHHEQRNRQAASGGRFAQSLAQAYQIDARNPNVGKAGALENLVSGAIRQMDKTGNAGAKVIAQSTLQMAREAARGNPKLKREYDKLADAVEGRFQGLGRTVNRVNGNIYSGSTREWARIREAVASPAEQAQQRASKAFTQIQQDAIGSLTAMGYSPAEARKMVRNSDASGKAASGGVVTSNQQTRSAGQSFMSSVTGGRTGPGNILNGTPGGSLPSNSLAGARGMRIPGQGTLDKVPLVLGMAAPGELIVNRHTEAQQNAINAAVGAPPLGSLVNNQTRPHSAYATGGRAGGLTAGMSALDSRLSGMGFVPGSTTGGKHAPNSYHYRGMATDFGDATNDLRRLWSVLYPMRNRFAELFGPSYLTPGPTLMHYGKGFSDATLQAGHQDHIHVALASALGNMRGLGRGGGAGGGLAGGGMPMLSLKRKAGGGGAPNSLYAAAYNAIAAGLERKINGSGAGGLGPAGPYRGGVMTAAQVARLAESVGLPGITFAQIARGESGYNPKAIGHDPGGTMGLGLWQITTGYNDDIIARFGGQQAMLNPRRNALAAKAIYDRQGIQAWYGTRYLTDTNAHFRGAQGGRIPWFGQGGSFRARRPMVIGVGDRDEDVHVIPRSGGGGGGGRGLGHNTTISIGAIHIANHRHGDIREQVKREVQEAFDHFATTMDESPLYDDKELVS